MKKLLAILLAAIMVFALASCSLGEKTDDEHKNSTQISDQVGEETGDTEKAAADEVADSDTDQKEIPTSGLPLNWPDNEYTKLVPAPNCGGKVTAANEIGTLYSVELNWTMEQGLVYAQQLADAGFGDDCAEKYEKHGYIDRTANGINVQLLDLFGTASISIMPVEE